MCIIQTTELESRTLNSVGYDSEKLVLQIKFNNGYHEKLVCVPEHIYKGLIQSKSKYNYYYENIKNKYPESI